MPNTNKQPNTSGDENSRAPNIPTVPPRATQEISRVAVKVPPFWRPNVKLWFMQLESQFVTANINVENTKFHYVLGAIESDVLNQVSDFLVSLPNENKYSLLKAKLIDEFSDSEARKARKLLTELQLGDRKPSALLREMRELAGTDISDQFLKNMFLQNMPDHIKAILACSKDSLDSLAQMADKILDTVPHEYKAYSVDTKNSRVNALEQQVMQLTENLKLLTDRNSRNRSSTPARNRKRSSSRDASRFPNCWYHFKFGNQAKKCSLPCAYNKEKSEN